MKRDEKRIDKFFAELRSSLSDGEICAGLGNGDIPRPHWLSISEDTSHIKAWDSYEGGSAQMGFIRVTHLTEDG